jgi:hypothetical protein
MQSSRKKNTKLRLSVAHRVVHLMQLYDVAAFYHIAAMAYVFFTAWNRDM